MKPGNLTDVITLAVTLGAGLALIVWDIYTAARYGSYSTISWQTWSLSHQYPIIPLLVGLIVGLLFGHLFWTQQP